MKKLAIFLFVLALLINKVGRSQDRFVSIENQLQNLVLEMPGLEDKVELSVNGVTIEEFIRGIAVTNKLNISVDPSLDTKIVNNFSNVNVIDVLLFLAKQHDLQITFTGSIIAISKYNPPLPPPEKPQPRKPGVEFASNKNLLTLDYNKEPLALVARDITSLTGKNVVVSSGLEENLVSGFIKDMPFDNAIDKFALANQLKVTKTEDNFYVFKVLEESQEEEEEEMKTNKRGHTPRKPVAVGGEFEMKASSIYDITLYANNVPISDIILSVCEELNLSYFMNSVVSGNANISVQNTSFDNLLNHLFNASAFTYEKKEDIYIIGERKIEMLRSTSVIQLQHRSLEKVIENIPAEMTQGVTIKEFPDLNSLILSGSKINIEEIAAFIRQIDKPVPVVLIEVMLIDYSTNRTVSAGIKVGIAENQQAASGGTVYPGLDYHFNSQSVNKLIDNFNGNGFLNLGKVTPNFYMNIRAMEEQGMIKVRSTPKLATLNGSEATMSIGKTVYYRVETSNYVGSQIATPVVTSQFQSLNADLKITIKPFVSGDDQITLEISVEQADFAEQIADDVPPGSVTRSFSSLLRVKNEEMILLGGLEQKSVTENGTGVPLLSRIPVIKWLFSTRSKGKSKSKLNIFIKPTVLY